MMFLLFLFLWLICVQVSFLGFYVEFNQVPDVLQSLTASHMTLPFSFPKSLGDLVGISKPNSTDLTVSLSVIFWPVFLLLAWGAIKRKSKAILGLVSVIAIAASYNWLNVAWGMMGI